MPKVKTPPTAARPKELKGKMKEKEEQRVAEEKRLKEEHKQEQIRIAAEKKREEAERLAKEKRETPEGQLHDLKRWISGIPLSRDKWNRHMERSFSDGVLVAEIMAFYCPELIKLKQFFRYHSSANKRVNWENLNWWVFRKIGIKVTDAEIRKVVRPYAPTRKIKTFDDYIIYELLQRVRDGIATINPSVFDFRNDKDYGSEDIVCNFVPPPPVERKLRVDITNIGPPFSKIEIQIGQGKFLDEDEENKREEIEKPIGMDIMEILENVEEVQSTKCEAGETVPSTRSQSLETLWTRRKLPACSIEVGDPGDKIVLKRPSTACHVLCYRAPSLPRCWTAI